MRAPALVIVVLVVVVPVGAQDAVKKEMAQLEGEWSLVSGEANGVSMPVEYELAGSIDVLS